MANRFDAIIFDFDGVVADSEVIANMVMVGFFAAVTDLFDVESVRSAIRSSVPSGTEELNLAAFDSGFNHDSGMSSRRISEEMPA